MINREELNWAAGFFDGEGSTFNSYPTWKGVKGTYVYPSMRMSVTQSGIFALELLERFKRAVGDKGRILGPTIMVNRKPRYDWKIEGLLQCQQVYSRLWMFLGPYKREQIHKSALIALNHIKHPAVTHPRGPAGHIKNGS